MGDVGVHVVDEAALFAQLHEEAGGHAFAEDDREVGERVAVGVVESEAGNGEGDVGLFRGLVFDGEASAVEAGRGRVGGVFGGIPLAERGGELLDDLLVVDVAGSSEDDVVGDVLLFEVVDRVVAADGPDGLGRAGDVAAEGVVGPHDRIEEEVGHLGRGVGDHGQLLEDDRAFLLHLGAVHERAADELDKDVEGELHVQARDLGVVDGVLAVRTRVEDAADGVDGLGDLLRGRALLGALEEQVLDEVGDAGLSVAFVPGASADVEGERDGVGVGHRRREDTEAVGGNGALEKGFFRHLGASGSVYGRSGVRGNGRVNGISRPTLRRRRGRSGARGRRRRRIRVSSRRWWCRRRDRGRRAFRRGACAGAR